MENSACCEIFRIVSRLPCYISCYIAKNRFPLGQCALCNRYLVNSRPLKAAGCSRIQNLWSLQCTLKNDKKTLFFSVLTIRTISKTFLFTVRTENTDRKPSSFTVRFVNRSNTLFFDSAHSEEL